jgi:thiamine biosynthesis lipoprotein
VIERTRARPLLGTFVVMSAAGPRRAVEDGLRRAFAAIERLEKRLSYFRPDSDVSRLNRGAHRAPVRVHPQTHRLLRAAARLTRASGGVFDIATGGALWRAGFRPPAPGAPRPDPRAAARDVVLLPGSRVRFRRPLWIDLGGIAKGHAVDRALAVLRAAGVDRARVNAGGDTASFGDPVPLWRRDDRRRDRIRPFGASVSGALATSAPFLHARAGRAPYAHRGRCARATAGVTVAAPRALWADALTKVALLAPSRARWVLPMFKARVVS